MTTFAPDALLPAKRDRRDKALQFIRDAWLIDDPEKLLTGCNVLARYLTETERVSLAWGLLRSLPVEIASEVAQGALKGAGAPTLIPALGNEVPDARFWAGLATQQELKAYAMEAFKQMPPRVKKSFAKWVNK